MCIAVTGRWDTVTLHGVLGVYLAFALRAGEALHSGVYQTPPGVTVEESGDRVPDNITCVPLPWLDISRVGTKSVQIAWPANFSDHVLECAAQLPAQSWSTVTNAPTPVGGRLTVTLRTEGSERFYRLRKP